MIPTRAIAAACALACMLWAGALPAGEDGTCGPRDAVLSQLARAFGETRQSIGLGGDNTVIEVFASPGTGSWTITVTTARGLTCLVASGQAFETLAAGDPLRGDPA